MRGEGATRTYSIWGFVACFSLMGVVGVALLLFVGSPGRPTEQVPTRQTLPDEVAAAVEGDGVADTSATPSTTTTTTTTTSTTEPPPQDAPTSSAAESTDLSDEVTQVLTGEGTTSFVFRAPAGVEITTLQTAVAPTAVRLSEDGRTAYLYVSCARSADEFLAQVLVSESDTTVTIAAISVAPPDGPPCPDPATPREVELQLPTAVGGRAISVVPRGTPVPPLGAS